MVLFKFAILDHCKSLELHQTEMSGLAMLEILRREMNSIMKPAIETFLFFFKNKRCIKFE